MNNCIVLMNKSKGIVVCPHSFSHCSCVSPMHCNWQALLQEAEGHFPIDLSKVTAYIDLAYKQKLVRLLHGPKRPVVSMATTASMCEARCGIGPAAVLPQHQSCLAGGTSLLYRQGARSKSVRSGASHTRSQPLLQSSGQYISWMQHI